MSAEYFTKFILDHADDDTSKLLFASDRYPGIDIRRAAGQIAARRKAATKLPSWFEHPEIYYPSTLSLEQCSSEAAALYKQRFVPSNCILADITGGLGVDCFFMSRKAVKAYYFEFNSELCEAARHNFTILDADNVEVSGCDHIDDSRHYNLIYADPARRGKASERIYSISDCEPDILKLKDSLITISDSLLVKISPMADISRTLAQIPETSELHVVSVENECKEILILIRREETRKKLENIPITCVDLGRNGVRSEYSFSIGNEQSAIPAYADIVGRYLYVPGKHVLKAGAFKSLGERFCLKKLSKNSHLYTSDSMADNFPGKIYRVKETLQWNKNTINSLRKQYDRLEMTSINFPIDTAALRKRIAITSGGDHHLYATTLGTRKICIIATEK